MFLQIDQLDNQTQRRERVDAARNRERILRAAERLFAERGVAGVLMEDVAREARVGKGTLYRRFADRGALAAALLDDRERRLQDHLLRGAPPIGPGAAPVVRLGAFLRALAELTEANLDLVLASETGRPGARYRLGAYAAWRLHVRVLAEQVDPAGDVDWLADALLAPLAAELYRHQRHELGMSAARIAAGVEELARNALRADARGAGPAA